MIKRLRVPTPAEAAGEFCSPQLTLCADSSSLSVPPPVLPQWHVKDPSHSVIKRRRQVTPKYEYILDSTKSDRADHAAVQAESGNLSGNELTCNLSGNIRPQSSQPAEPLWTDPDIKSGISVRELISTSKKKKKRAGWE